MRHLSLLAAGLMASTMLCGAAAIAQTSDQSTGSSDNAAPAADNMSNQDRHGNTGVTAGYAAANQGAGQSAPDQYNSPGANPASTPHGNANAARGGNDNSISGQASNAGQTEDTSNAEDNGQTGNAAQAANDSGERKAVDQDFGQLSTDGADAFDDIHSARLALFEGRTGEATKLVADAKASLDRAKNDNVVFMKAESELQGPDRSSVPQDKKQDEAHRTAWIPIDAQIVVGEAYQPSSDKDAAIVMARKNLRHGDSEKALETLRMAAVDVDYTMTVAPVTRSVADVDMASDLMNSHDYYGAMQALRKAEEGVRYDEIDDVANAANRASSTESKNDRSGG